jgi:hypothetical protein
VGYYPNVLLNPGFELVELGDKARDWVNGYDDNPYRIVDDLVFGETSRVLQISGNSSATRGSASQTVNNLHWNFLMLKFCCLWIHFEDFHSTVEVMLISPWSLFWKPIDPHNMKSFQLHLSKLLKWLNNVITNNTQIVFPEASNLTIRISGLSKVSVAVVVDINYDIQADGVNGTEGIGYSIFAELFYADGSNESIVAPFVVGDHDYQLSQLIFTPPLPVARITFHCNFQMKGSAYFDRVSLQQKIPGKKFQ